MSTTVEALYASPGIAESVEFSLHPAIRKRDSCVGENGLGNYSCPDEDCGCPMTGWVLCGLHATDTTQTQQVNFLGCWDGSQVQWSDEWTLDPAAVAAESCINETNPDALMAFRKCGNGPQVTQLKDEAAAYLDEMFPHGIGVPSVWINKRQQDINLDGSDLWEFASSLCASGADAALCGAFVPSVGPPSLEQV